MEQIGTFYDKGIYNNEGKMTYQPVPTHAEGNQKQIWVSDDDIHFLLEQILRELKKMNLHLELLTDEEITNQEVE